ncbi:MAG: DUF5615 family PIN-like protein [SAR324 cluster bacterium]|nr:DUF5615 family PIN-like protein [SAR324 cluster bacterium]
MNDAPIKFLMDIGVGKKVEAYLKEKGFDVKNIRDLDPKMPDEKIIQIAAMEHRIVVTMDKDFGELVYHSSIVHSGVLLLRLEDAGSERKVQVVQNIIENHSKQLVNSFCVFQKDTIRIRKLS